MIPAKKWYFIYQNYQKNVIKFMQNGCKWEWKKSKYDKSDVSTHDLIWIVIFFALYKNTLWVKSGPVHAFYRCLLAFIRQMLPCFINHIVGTPKHVINNYLRISKDLLVKHAKTLALATVIKVDFNYIMLTDFTVGNKLF